MRRSASIIALLCLAATPTARADEAVRRDGSRVTGKLALSAAGRFTFRASDRDEPVADLEFIRFTIKPPAAPMVPLWHQIRLEHGEVLHAELRRLDDGNLIVRPAWVEAVSVPRPAIERVTQLPGERLILFETFESGLSAWTRTGEVRVESGRLLLTAGQAIESQVKTPVAAGRIGVTFLSAVTKSRTLAVELGFERDGKPAPVRVELVGPDERHTVASPAKPEHDGRLKRTAGASRVTAEFDSGRLHVYLDQFVLWTQSSGPGELRSIRLMAGGDGTETATVDDVLVARSERPTDSRSWADLTADAVRSPDGDETFGSLAAVGPTGVVLEIRGRKVLRSWPDASELAYRRSATSELATTGEHVRVRVRSIDGARDVLDGAVQSVNDNSLVLSHALLGKLTIPRDRLEELRLMFHGRRVPMDTAPHHLGSRPAFGFAVPKPEGLRLAKTVTVDPHPENGFVVVDAAGLNRTGTPLEMRVNGEVIGELNRLADRTDAIVRAYRLAVPATNWRRGENEVELRLRPDDSGKRVTSVDIRAVRLELHDPR